MKDDAEKAAEIRKKRDLAAKGIAERKDGKPIDPVADAGTLDPDNDPENPLSPEEQEKEVATRAAAIGFALKR